MLTFDERDEVFFDSADYLSSEESTLAKEEVVRGKLEYEIWMSEPQSIRERRDSFLREMELAEFAFKSDMSLGNSSEIMASGLAEFASKSDKSYGNSSEIMESGRTMGSSGAVSSFCASSVNGAGDCSACSRREGEGYGNSMVDELEHDWLDKTSIAFDREASGDLPSAQQSAWKEVQAIAGECEYLGLCRRKIMNWWKRFTNKRSKLNSGTSRVNKMKVRPKKKSCMEFTALYLGQEIQAHEGYIRTMKFSPDGQYLASGGEDGIVRIWRVLSMDASCKDKTSDFCSKVEDDKISFQQKKSSHPSIVIPDKIFQIEESPLQEFRGHVADVLDLAWSNTNYLLSSSKDKTVRLWKVSCTECLSVFHHRNYVTCIQFNPIDHEYFISGSIDGKVRIWGVSESRVVDWADVRDVVTAVCYQPRGDGFIVGTVTGNCRFYDASGSHLQLDAQLHIQGRRKTSGSRITGIQFSQKEPQRLMITSEDSKVRIFDGVDVVHKYKGFPRSGSQMSASFTSTDKHIISVGEDSRIYVWDYGESRLPSSKQAKSTRSCEHFFFEGVSVAIPWSRMGRAERSSDHGVCLHRSKNHSEAASWIRDSERFSLANWFMLDGPSRRSATWPEEKLPLWELPIAHQPPQNHLHELLQMQQPSKNNNCTALSSTWGLVIVTASRDGRIRTLHNYGLPVKL